MLLGIALPEVPQGPFQETKNPRKRVEFLQKIVDPFQRRWTKDVLSLLVQRRKWNSKKRIVQVDDIVIAQDGTAIRGKWKPEGVVDVYPRSGGKVRNVKVKNVKLKKVAVTI